MAPSSARVDPADAARRLGISLSAVELHYDAEIVDLHVDSYIWWRIGGYDFRRRHAALTRGVLLGQFDLPRARDAGIGCATWVVTTNPFCDAREREQALFDNLRELTELLETPQAAARVVRSVAAYRAARALGLHAAFVGVQGGNALARSLDAIERLSPGLVLRVTLLHLTSSRLGASSAPPSRNSGLTAYGKDFVRRLDAARIFVDLAHISPAGFWDAVDAHDRSLPLLVTHTGVSAVHRHWRNLDDEQLRAIARSGGTIGIMYHSEFLEGRTFRGRLEAVVRHLEHAVNVAGEDHVSLGSDWDGAIVTPRDMQTCEELPRLTHALLERRWPEQRVRKVLGLNFLRVVESVRG
jgi:membrane dipeptidase